MAIKFNNLDIPAYVKVNDVKVSVLPPVTQTTIKVNGKAGSHDFGNQIGERTILVAISIIADSPSDLKDKIREFGQWLYYEEAKELVILDESDKYYMAKFTGDSSFDEILKVGKGVISFTCHDPYVYGNEKVYTFNPTDSIPYPFNNSGGTTAYPKMKFEFTQDTSEFSIITDDEFLLFGKPTDIEKQVTKDTTPIVMYEDLSTLNGWTTAGQIEGGLVTSSFTTNGYSVSVKDFGENPNGWKGASMVKAMPKELQDFKLRGTIGFKGSHINQIGRVTISLLDKNGTKIGKIEMLDGTVNGYHTKAVAQAGSTYFVDDFGAYAGVFKNWTNGLVEISRTGNKWYAYYCILDEKGRQHTRLAKQWIDTKNINMAKVSQIQIHIGAFKNYAPLNSMWISHITVWDYKPAVTSNEVPLIFKKGDVLEIDNETGMVLLNGQPYYTSLDPSSSFIKLKKGDNGIMVAPANITTNGEIKLTERWL